MTTIPDVETRSRLLAGQISASELVGESLLLDHLGEPSPEAEAEENLLRIALWAVTRGRMLTPQILETLHVLRGQIHRVHRRRQKEP